MSFRRCDTKLRFHFTDSSKGTFLSRRAIYIVQDYDVFINLCLYFKVFLNFLIHNHSVVFAGNFIVCLQETLDTVCGRTLNISVI